jgi:hypothetical protein
VSLTSCPGGKTYDMLPALRKQVARLQGPVLLNPKASPSTVKVIDGRSVSGAVTFTSRLRPAGAWTVTVRTAAGTPVHTMSGYGKDMSARWLPTGVQPGKYRYTMSSPGRRAATGTLRLRAPSITASASASTAVFESGGALRKPVTFTGQLWKGAQWRLRIRNAAGERVFLSTGTGKDLAVTWPGPVVTPGRHTWRVAADGTTPVTGVVTVSADLVTRTGTADAPAKAAAAISRRAFGPYKATHAVLAPDTSPALAQAGAALAGRGGPLLYTDPAVLPDATMTELERVLPDDMPLYVLGDTSFIGDAVLAALGDRWDVRQLAAATGSDVAALAAEEVVQRNPTQSAVLVATGKGWRQGIAGATYAARNDLPILLTNRGSLNPSTAAAITDLGITEVTIVGNADAVSNDVRDALPSSVRVGRSTAAKTAVAVSSRLFARTVARHRQAWQFANVDRGDGWYRAAAGAVLGARTNAPLLVSSATRPPPATRDYLNRLGYAATRLGTGVVLGDTSHVSKAARSALARQLQ